LRFHRRAIEHPRGPQESGAIIIEAWDENLGSLTEYLGGGV
jgi:hypothetical protein